MKRGFTLPEMLVVIGVIAVLIALLLPALSRARESANQVICLGRLRQVGMATMQYCSDNRGSFPGAGNGAGTSGTGVMVPYDWIYWDTNAAAPFNDVTKCALAKYMDIGNGDVFRCPSDSLYRVNPNPYHAGESGYQYSFSMNAYLGNGPYYAFLHPSAKLVQVRNSSDVILFIDEDERTVNDGTWLPKNIDRLSSKHDVHKDQDDPTGRGNVIFCDGHGEFVTRQFTFDQSHFLFPN